MTAPTVVLGALSAMLPRLQAEEAIGQANVLRFASGQLDERAARQLRDRWERAAAGRTGQQLKRRPSKAEWKSQVEALGIEVTVHDRAGHAPESAP